MMRMLNSLALFVQNANTNKYKMRYTAQELSRAVVFTSLGYHFLMWGEHGHCKHSDG